MVMLIFIIVKLIYLDHSQTPHAFRYEKNFKLFYTFVGNIGWQIVILAGVTSHINTLGILKLEPAIVSSPQVFIRSVNQLW